ncbi:MAG TPA: Ku protein [Stellaceae bacterium]|nr:Ku protein [Stellaceae bacterium]
MPRPSWSGHLKLSLVSCPIYLAPATSESERIRMHQINPKTGNRISLKPVDAETGEPVERGELLRGYEFERGQYVTLTKDEIDELQVESSKTLNLTRFVDRDEIAPLYLDMPYYVYPDGAHAVEAYEVIAHAMAKKNMAALGKIVMSSRERLVAIEPFGKGLMMMTLRTADEVRQPEFDHLPTKIEPEMVAMAEQIVDKLSGEFDPSTFRDSYQDALRELVAEKMKGHKPAKRQVEEPASNVVDLMAALRSSIEREGTGAGAKRRGKEADRRQQALLLPVKGGGKKAAAAAPAAEEHKPARRKKA